MGSDQAHLAGKQLLKIMLGRLARAMVRERGRWDPSFGRGMWQVVERKWGLGVEWGKVEGRLRRRVERRIERILERTEERVRKQRRMLGLPEEET